MVVVEQLFGCLAQQQTDFVQSKSKRAKTHFFLKSCAKKKNGRFEKVDELK